MSQPLTDVSVPQTEPSSMQDTTIAMNLISSEAGHEVVQSLNYLRFLVRSQKGNTATAEIIGLAGAEVERLERLVGHLRQFKLPALVLTKVKLTTILEQSLSEIRETSMERTVYLAAGVPTNLYVYTDATYLAKSLRCLVAHALVHAPSSSTLTVRTAPVDSAQESVALEVVDAGPPLQESSPAALFDIWTMLTPESQAGRRVFAHRLLRNLGSTLTYEHTDSCNVFRFSLPLARVAD